MQGPRCVRVRVSVLTFLQKSKSCEGHHSLPVHSFPLKAMVSKMWEHWIEQLLSGALAERSAQTYHQQEDRLLAQTHRWTPCYHNYQERLLFIVPMQWMVEDWSGNIHVFKLVCCSKKNLKSKGGHLIRTSPSHLGSAQIWDRWHTLRKTIPTWSGTCTALGINILWLLSLNQLNEYTFCGPAFWRKLSGFTQEPEAVLLSQASPN